MHEGTALSKLVAQGAYARVADRAPEHVATPSLVEGCTTLFTLSSSRSCDPACSYIRPHQLVSHHSLVPGLLRFDREHHPTLALSRFSHTALQPARPSRLRSVQLARVELHVDTVVLRCASYAIYALLPFAHRHLAQLACTNDRLIHKLCDSTLCARLRHRCVSTRGMYAG